MKASGMSEVQTKKEWDEYWSSKKTRILYDFIAEIYRRVLIRPSLNHFIRKHFSDGDLVLHAGCGSGQVDSDIRKYVRIIALDISPNALQIYRRENGDDAQTLQGSIFTIPLPEGAVRGIYNLGVMEHFYEDDIQKILLEFSRVLTADGKMVLFWPPEFGLSVLFFKSLKWIFATFLRRSDVQFHPDEVCRVQSRAHVERMLDRAGLRVEEYYFGPRDFFTYSVIIARKK
jgi:SAM-dependent methyltransferase